MESLLTMIEEKKSHTGFEVELIINNALNSLVNEEVELARQLKARYFNAGNEYKPLKFVYYRLIKTRQGEWSLRRNLYMSPRASGYFNTESVTTDPIRLIVRSRESVLGSDLKRYVSEFAGEDYKMPTSKSTDKEVEQIAYNNLSKQLANYIKEYFIDCEKPIKDDVWYCISCKEYGTATVYRDLNKSPRNTE